MAADPGYSLHQCAVDAEAAVEKLATELAHAGIDPQAVAGVSKMAASIRQIVKVLGQGQESQPTAPPAAAPPPPGGHTIGSATDAMHAQILAQHGH
jgi:hypothetical protein